MSTDRPGATEFSPSDVRADEPTVARVVGLVGLGATTLGVAAVLAKAVLGSDRWISSSMGYLFAVVGIACLLYHAIRDADIEIRRVYGGLSGLLLLGAVVVSFIPGTGSDAILSAYGYYFLPWGAVCALLGLLFGVAFLRNETDDCYRRWGESALLGVGVGMLTLTAILGLGGAVAPVGPVAVLGLLGLLFLSGFLAQTDTADGLGYWVAVGLGVLGAGLVLAALGRVIFPTVLFDGPKALRRLDQTLDYWAMGARAVLVLLCVGGGWWAIRAKGLPVWLRGLLALTAVGFAAVFVVGSFTNPLTVEPKGYLVPSGLLLMGLGVLFLGVSVGVCSEHPLVVLTRRELGAYFCSPVAYLVLFGTTVMAALGYSQLVSMLTDPRSVSDILEPILSQYWAFDIVGAITTAFVVPVLTMRTFSEEKRTGTFEMLLTAPVSEATVVLSKFVASLLFYLATWIPAGLFLVGLWVAGGQPFQYKPALGFFLAVTACGCGFIGLGVFFSSLTRNQIVAAVLTFAAMMFMLLTVVRPVFASAFSPEFLNVLKWVDYLGLWRQALNGQLPVPELVAQVSFGVFWLLLTIKVLEARKWN